MPSIVYLNGRPGSGKSQFARAINAHYGSAGGVVILNDYYLLWEMCQEEQSWPEEKRRFRLHEQGEAIGFDILDHRVLPIALTRLAEEARRQQHAHKLVIIEFSRSNYAGIYDTFFPDLLEDAQFFFLSAPFDLCVQRIDQRAQRNLYRDDKPISEQVMRSRYYDDGYKSWFEACGHQQGARILHNAGSWARTWLEARAHLDPVMYSIARTALWSSTGYQQTRLSSYKGLNWRPQI